MNGKKLLWDVGDFWGKEYSFFTDVYTYGNEIELVIEKGRGKNKNWNECKNLLKKDERMLNIAELVYLWWKHEDLMEDLVRYNYIWSSSASPLGNVLVFGCSECGADVNGYGASLASSDFGLSASCIEKVNSEKCNNVSNEDVQSEYCTCKKCRYCGKLEK